MPRTSPPGLVGDPDTARPDRAPRAVEERVRGAIDTVGGVDVLVNNAGYGLVGAVEETSEDEARHQLETNFWGTWKLVHAALPALRASSDARIMNITSTSGIVGISGDGVLCGVEVRGRRLQPRPTGELAPLGVAVTIIEPGGFRTEWAGPGLRRLRQSCRVLGTIAAKMRRGCRPAMGGNPATHSGQPTRWYGSPRRRTHPCGSRWGRTRSSRCVSTWTRRRPSSTGGSSCPRAPTSRPDRRDG